MGILANLLPRESRFYTFFEQVCVNLRDGAVTFARMADAPDHAARAAIRDAVKEVEGRNDVVTHEIFDELHKSFITPIDREDIHLLASALDDLLDLMNSTAERIVVYKVSSITAEMKGLLALLRQSVESVATIVGMLRRLKGPQSIVESVRSIHSLEKEGDALYSKAMGNLFTNGAPVLDVIKWKDIYLGVEQALDKCQYVANVTEGIAIKHS